MPLIGTRQAPRSRNDNGPFGWYGHALTPSCRTLGEGTFYVHLNGAEPMEPV